MMKQLDVSTVHVGENTFYLTKFPAFKAANLFGQLVKLLAPALGGILPALSGENGSNGSGALDRELNWESVGTAITSATAGLSGDSLEKMLKQLLLDYGNVAYDDPEKDKTVKLTEAAANELFCGDVQDMILLAVEVIKLNYSGFFTKLSTQFGSVLTPLLRTGAANTEK